MCAPHALINCAYVNEQGRPGTEANCYMGHICISGYTIAMESFPELQFFFVHSSLSYQHINVHLPSLFLMINISRLKYVPIHYGTPFLAINEHVLFVAMINITCFNVIYFEAFSAAIIN